MQAYLHFLKTYSQFQRRTHECKTLFAAFMQYLCYEVVLKLKFP